MPTTKNEIEVTDSGGNIFADLGMPNPEIELTKARLASQIRRKISALKLTHHKAAAKMGVRPSVIAAIMETQTGSVSVSQLQEWLDRLVGIVTRKSSQQAAVKVRDRVPRPGRAIQKR
jgi:predicted XRE-type DNA-binding protein